MTEGSSILFYFKSLSDIQLYIKEQYARHLTNFYDEPFELQYIRVIAQSDSVSAVSEAVKKFRTSIKNKTYYDILKK